MLQFWIDLQYHVVLIQLREHCGNLTLAERVIQSVVDQLRRDSQPRSGIAIDNQHGLATVVLLVGRLRRVVRGSLSAY